MLSQNVEQEHVCSICLQVYIHPVRITLCNHVFCQQCIQLNRWAQNQKKCPLCRTQYQSTQIEKKSEFWGQLQALYPNVIQAKLKLQSNKRFVKLVVGNTTKEIATKQANKYEWEMKVDTPEGQPSLKQIAHRVQLQLHPTFNPRKVTYNLEHQLVRLRRIGWGTFNIEGKIYWKGQFQEKYSEFNHHLQFHHESFNHVIFNLHAKIQK